MLNTEIEDVLRRPYAWLIVPRGSGGYNAAIVEFPGCTASGESVIQAHDQLAVAAAAWVAAQLERGAKIPEPITRKYEPKPDTSWSDRLASAVGRAVRTIAIKMRRSAEELTYCSEIVAGWQSKKLSTGDMAEALQQQRAFAFDEGFHAAVGIITHQKTMPI